MLGVVFSILSAASFALNNALVRRGVVTGTPGQAMAITVPMGVLCFAAILAVLGELGGLARFSPHAVMLMACFGGLHFVLGRFCNFTANQVAGANLTAPVIQLQVVVTMALAVVILHEPCSALQIVGGALMFAGTLITQRQPLRSRPARTAPANATADAAQPLPRAVPVFKPNHLKGYLFASLAALAYGGSPILARFALGGSDPTTGLMGGLIAYVSATILVAFALLAAPVRRDLRTLRRGNGRWFVYCGFMTAAAQGFFFCAIALAPVLLVMPLMQLALAFRLVFSTWINPDHEVFGALVVLGTGVSIVGALLVSIDTGIILDAVALPDPLAAVLRWRI